MRSLIVNADDLGYSVGINKGIFEAYERGIVTSTSLMVNGQRAEDAVRQLKRYPKLGVGLHFVLTEEESKPRLAIEIAGWVFFKAEEVKRELLAQFEKFKQLTGRNPDHIDGHMFNFHWLPRIGGHFKELSRFYGIPLRADGEARLVSDFFGRGLISGIQRPERISLEHLVRVLRNLPDGVFEMVCHPGYATEFGGGYVEEREVELRILTDPKVKEVIKEEGIQLINWSQISK